MPCNTIRTVSLDLQAADMDLMAAALADLGYRDILHTRDTITASMRGRGKDVTIVTGQLRTGQTADMNDRVNAIRRAYAGRTLAKASKRFGWGMRQVQGSGTRQFQISRR